MFFPPFSFVPAAALRVSGPDALAFLQGQFTQDLRKVALGSGTYGLWLTLKGKIVGDSVVVALASENFLIVSEHTPAQVLRERLESFLIADDAVISDETGMWKALWRSTRRDPGDPLQPGILSLAIEGPGHRFLELWPAGPVELAGETGDLEAYVRFRYHHGVPAIPSELGEGDLPQEAGLEAYAISFTKGCYLGQEVMARLHSMGQVRRRLMTLQGTGAAPSRGTPLACGDKPCGDVRGAVAEGAGGRWIGLAMVNRLAIVPGGPITCEGREVWIPGSPAKPAKEEGGAASSGSSA